MKTKYLLLLIMFFSLSFIINAKDDKEKKDTSLAEIVGGLKWRNIGPAFTPEGLLILQLTQ